MSGRIYRSAVSIHGPCSLTFESMVASWPQTCGRNAHPCLTSGETLCPVSDRDYGITHCLHLSTGVFSWVVANNRQECPSLA